MLSFCQTNTDALGTVAPCSAPSWLRTGLAGEQRGRQTAGLFSDLRRQAGEGPRLPARTAGASRLEGLKPARNSVQSLSLGTVFKQRERKRRGACFFPRRESPAVLGFGFLSFCPGVECNGRLFIQQLSSREFLFILEINYVVEHISLCILIHN